jgi:hypothetical protein
MSGSAAHTPTMESRVGKLFGLSGDSWMRHANPVSVWTRFSVVSLLVLAIWSRDWIGWYCLVPIALALIWMFINPLLFKEPKSTRHWASKAVFGERIWTERNDVDIPQQFRSQIPNVANGLSSLGLIAIVYGLLEFDVLVTVCGILIVHLGKLWYLDRMVLLFEDVKDGGRYTGWEY